MTASGPPCEQLSLWLSDNELKWRPGSKEHGVELARNQSITGFLRHDVPKGKTHLLCFDHDMIPLRETRHILRGDDELAYCGHVGKHGSRGHVGNGDFGAACFRVSADLLQRMGKPWWQTTVVNGVRVECECAYFRKRAEGVGAKAKMVGLVGHQQTCILVPTSEPPGYVVKWAEDLPQP